MTFEFGVVGVLKHFFILSLSRSLIHLLRNNTTQFKIMFKLETRQIERERLELNFSEICERERAVCIIKNVADLAMIRAIEKGIQHTQTAAVGT